MNIVRTPSFRRAFKTFPPSVQMLFEKQIAYLVRDIRHPSLHAKKYGGTTDVWQARVSRNVRFYFRIENDVYRLLNIRKHAD